MRKVVVGCLVVLFASTAFAASPLPLFEKDLCGSYLEQTASQQRTALRRELAPLKLTRPVRECIVRAVVSLDLTGVCLAGDFSAESMAAWEDAVEVAFSQCQPGPVPTPEPEPPATPAAN